MRIKTPADIIKKQTVLPRDPAQIAKGIMRSYPFWGRLFESPEILDTIDGAKNETEILVTKIPYHLFSSKLSELSTVLKAGVITPDIKQASESLENFATRCRTGEQEVDNQELYELLQDVVFYLEEVLPSENTSEAAPSTGYILGTGNLNAEAIDFFNQNNADGSLTASEEFNHSNLRIRRSPDTNVFWVVGSGFEREKPIPKDAIAYRFLITQESDSKEVIKVTEDEIIGAVRRANEFLKVSPGIRNGIIVQGKDFFVMEVGGETGIRVNYRIIDSLLKAVKKGNDQKIGFYRSDLESTFVHERTHEQRGETSLRAGKDLIGAEIAAFSNQAFHNRIISPFMQEHINLAFNTANITASEYSHSITLAYKMVVKFLEDIGFKLENYKPETVKKAIDELELNNDRHILSELASQVIQMPIDQMISIVENLPGHKVEKLFDINGIEVWNDENVTFPAIVFKLNGQISLAEKRGIRLNSNIAEALMDKSNPLYDKAQEVLERAVSISEATPVIPLKRNGEKMTLEEYSAVRLIRRFNSSGVSEDELLLQSDSEKNIAIEFLQNTGLLNNPQACLLLHDYAANTNAMYGLLIERDYVF